MTGIDPVVLFGVILALAMNFINGLNDAAHAIATVVATKVLSPVKAVFLTAICNMIGPFIFTTAVAMTIGTSVIHSSALTPRTIIIAILVSTVLVLVATRAGIPISSSHALIGGLIGACVAAAGFAAVIYPAMDTVSQTIMYGIAGAVIGALVVGSIAKALDGDVRLSLLIGAICGAATAIPLLMILGVLTITGLFAIILFIFISPILGVVTAFLFDLLISHLFRYSRQDRMKRIFSPLQIVACLFQAAGHGANDGQHAVGIITALLLSAGILSTFDIPLWVILTSAIAIGLGTCFGGWKVVDKMAKKITKIRPYQGFCAATAGSATLSMVTTYGVPVSSTHVISGAIIGVGVTRGKNAVQWKVVREMMTAWVVTIPLAAICAFVGYLLFAMVTLVPL
ncbi:inorganic phosphate transporter [Methanoregula sp.]|jgi:PiT family inorganic phosphate transporter|uniref:inorganic phosphate transporter n=1 Tax=Methanoregula sp. TaxID=2052170 RepID=UPI0025FF5954|nr:inorganic phosphate transporter [Methanoregula sp.]